MRMKAILLEGKPETGANHLPTEMENDTMVHRQISILLSAICGIIDASQPQVVENGENSHTDNSVIRQIKCGLLPQIKNNFLRYAEALQSVLFATISAHCFM